MITKNKHNCPLCNNLLHEAGKIHIKDFNNEDRLNKIYYCKICGWRGT